MKKIFMIIMFILMLSCLSFEVFADEKSDTTIKKVVSIVYDDSGSMNNSNEDWAYASYSLQNLIGLMNTNDELGVVKMSKPFETIEFNLKDNDERKSDIKSIYNWSSNGGTPFVSVDSAVSWLKTKKANYSDSQNVEYWLIVITDGSFGSGYPTNMKSYLDGIKKSMGNSKYEGVLVAIGNGVPYGFKNDWKKVADNHLITAANSNSIVDAMSEVAGLILGQGGQSANIVPTVSTDGMSITFETSLPLHKFIIFEQNQNSGVKDILGNEINGNVVADFSTNKPGSGKVSSRIIHCEAVDGDYFPTGKITVNFDSKIDVSNSKFKILAMPAVNVSLKLVDKTGNLITDINDVSIKEGEVIEFAAVVTSSIDNSIIDLRNWNKSLVSELIVNDKKIEMKYNQKDNMFYGKYKVEAGSNLTYAIVTLPGFFRAKSDVINVYPKEVADNISLNVSQAFVDVPYKYVSEYEEVALLEYVITGSQLSGMCDLKFINMPKGIAVSVNGIKSNEDGIVSLKMYNDVPTELIVYRNKDYKEIEKSTIKIDVTCDDYQIKLKDDSKAEIILNPLKRNISIKEVKLENADNLKLNNFDGKDIYIVSVLGDLDYLSKEELKTLTIENSKIRGISLKSEVIEYNGRYALKIYCEKELIELLVSTGDISSSLSLKTVYNEKSNNINIFFKIMDSFTKYILPLLLLLMIILLIGYMPGVKKRINRHYCIQMNGQNQMIAIKTMTKIMPYVSEVGVGGDLKIVATSNSNKICVINNFNGQEIYIDDELIQNVGDKFEIFSGAKLKIVDGYRESMYVYLDSRSSNMFSNDINDISSLEFGFNDDGFTSSNFNEDYF